MFEKLNYKYSFLKVLNSPFKKLKLTWYFGKIIYGTPYFLPRKWVKNTKEDAIKSANEALNRKNYPDNRSFDELVKYYIKHEKPIPIKYFGFHFISLGWKTKWGEYRFEWNPCISIVLFGKQLFIGIIPNIDPNSMYDCYWETWLNYEYDTNKSLSKLERLEELISKHSCTWIHYKDGNKISVNHYKYILKEKYLKLVDIEATVKEVKEDI